MASTKKNSTCFFLVHLREFPKSSQSSLWQAADSDAAHVPDVQPVEESECETGDEFESLFVDDVVLVVNGVE